MSNDEDREAWDAMDGDQRRVLLLFNRPMAMKTAWDHGTAAWLFGKGLLVDIDVERRIFQRTSFGQRVAAFGTSPPPRWTGICPPIGALRQDDHQTYQILTDRFYEVASRGLDSYNKGMQMKHKIDVMDAADLVADFMTKYGHEKMAVYVKTLVAALSYRDPDPQPPL